MDTSRASIAANSTLRAYGRNLHGRRAAGHTLAAGVRLFFMCIAALVVSSAAAHAGQGACTKGVPISNTACTQVFPANDVSGGRHYMLLQCTGGNTCYCAIGTNGAGTANAGASTDGMQIGASGQSWTSGAYPGGQTVQIPLGDVCCITASGSSEIVACDW